MATITSKGCSGSSLFSCGLFVSSRETLLPRGDDLQNKPFCSFDFRQLPKLGQLYQVYELNCRFITRGGAPVEGQPPPSFSPFAPKGATLFNVKLSTKLLKISSMFARRNLLFVRKGINVFLSKQHRSSRK